MLGGVGTAPGCGAGGLLSLGRGWVGVACVMAAWGGETDDDAVPVGAGGLEPGCAGGGPYLDAEAAVVVAGGIDLLVLGDSAAAVALGALAAVMGLELNVCTGAMMLYCAAVPLKMMLCGAQR